MRDSVMNLKLQKAQISKMLLAGNRPSLAVPPDKINLQRASVKYQQESHRSGEAGELEIENDRLKTTLMILTQKLKMKEDDGMQELE